MNAGVSSVLGACLLAVVMQMGVQAGVASDEDPRRCPCWYMGYEAAVKAKQAGRAEACTTVPPDDAVECEMIDKREYWEDGCKLANAGKPKKCTYPR